MIFRYLCRRILSSLVLSIFFILVIFFVTVNFIFCGNVFDREVKKLEKEAFAYSGEADITAECTQNSAARFFTATGLTDSEWFSPDDIEFMIGSYSFSSSMRKVASSAASGTTARNAHMSSADTIVEISTARNEFSDRTAVADFSRYNDLFIFQKAAHPLYWDNDVMISKAFANQQNLKIGSEVELMDLNGYSKYKVSAICYDDGIFFNRPNLFLVDHDALIGAALPSFKLYNRLFIKLKDESKIADFASKLSKIEDFRDKKIVTKFDNDILPTAEFNSIVPAIMSYFVVAMSIVIVFMLARGIVKSNGKNTAIMSSLGFSFSQVSAINFAQILLLTVIGLILGCVGGVAFTNGGNAVMLGVSASVASVVSAVFVILLSTCIGIFLSVLCEKTISKQLQHRKGIRNYGILALMVGVMGVGAVLTVSVGNVIRSIDTVFEYPYIVTNIVGANQDIEQRIVGIDGVERVLPVYLGLGNTFTASEKQVVADIVSCRQEFFGEMKWILSGNDMKLCERVFVSGKAIISKSMSLKNGLNVGDKISIKSGNTEKAVEIGLIVYSRYIFDLTLFDSAIISPLYYNSIAIIFDSAKEAAAIAEIRQLNTFNYFVVAQSQQFLLESARNALQVYESLTEIVALMAVLMVSVLAYLGIMYYKSNSNNYKTYKYLGFSNLQIAQREVKRNAVRIVCTVLVGVVLALVCLVVLQIIFNNSVFYLKIF